ncbi:hypothetical protein TSOC_004464 [Tetrabaena socialis]|uniref:Uncharacterized protein n=1 Tax=Tetrabaena socialis TaxID=47790 RepID=A0A2J8A8S6_9CHLO|nr:hypothetical protein TSOC_004464 [Tetrabaena socialis]|eukprot:PNH08942.1 hypothetical protein TSOC_004464 [Tetrabaena socialis]
MRKRPIDPDQTSLFIDTQPRLVNREEMPRRPRKPLVGGRVAHSGLWRVVAPELRRGRAMTLRVRDGPTGAVSDIDLGRVAFSRERSIPAGGEGRCVYEQHGTWQTDATCSVHEYLWGLCVKVARDAVSGAYTLDTGLGGGPGCGPEWGWEAGQWRRLDERANRVNGRVYLPTSARNATVVSVRHGHDPSILERNIVQATAPNMEHQILFHAIGLALCFLGLVLGVSVAVFAAPALKRRSRPREC